MTSHQTAAISAASHQDARIKQILATQHMKAGRFAEARAAYLQLVAIDPANSEALHQLGLIEHRLGHSCEGAAFIRQALAIKPQNIQAHSDLAAILITLGRFDEAADACRATLVLDPDFAPVYTHLGDIMLRQGYHEAAEQAYAHTIGLQHGCAAAHAGRAEALAVLGRFEEASEACDIALQYDEDLPQAHGARGFILYKRGQTTEAARAFKNALQLDPGMALTHARLGNLYHAKGLFEEALTAYQCAIEVEPQTAEFVCNKALALQALGRFDDAFDAFSKALTLRPDFPDALTRLGILLNTMGRYDEAIEALRKAVELAPRHSGAYLNLAGVLKERDRLAEAAEVYRTLFSLEASPMPAALFDYCHLRRHLCDWNGLAEAERQTIETLKASGVRAPPFAALGMACKPQDHLALARNWANGFEAAASAPVCAHHARPSARDRRIRIGYLSNDFYDHATASLVAELFERQDRNRFELFAYCFSPDDGSAMRRRLVEAFDQFVPIGKFSHKHAVQRIVNDRIDILVDLKGYTRGARPLILASRPAPIQVNYLGYPSTMGAPFIDYFIADPFVAPMEHQPFFDEKIVHLPDCYQPNDRYRRTAATPRSRKDYGLPEKAFIFCAFNGVYKITPEFFSIWMRLLGQMPGSVLWLLDDNEVATVNLRREATARGIDPERLVFAPKVPIAEHQARYAHADLFLDNLPVNGHTTASEALWAELPIVTCAGDVFVGRVAGSLLHACGLPELVTHSLDEYEALALRLAGDRALLANYRDRLERQRLTLPLFDTERYARNLEAAFTHMVHLHERGLPPEAFAVAALADN
jgi:predicted O-linked N-acetylglucosamine transferase (SPINDLY family)